MIAAISTTRGGGSFFRTLVFILTALTLGASSNAFSANTPDVNKIIQDATKPAALPPPAPSPEIKAPAQPKPVTTTGSSDVRIKVTTFKFHGNDSISEADLRAAVADSENKSLNFGELMGVVEKVEAVYKAAGYFLAQAYLPPQKIKDGAIEINISEGKLGQSRLEGESRIKPEVIYGYLDNLPKGRAVKLNEVERQVLLINDLAGSSASLDMQAGADEGTTDVVISQKVEPLLSGRVELNNHGMPSTGQYHEGLFVNASSQLGRGDRLSANVMHSNTGNIDSYGLNYDLPVFSQGVHLTAGTSLAQYRIGGGTAASLNSTGSVYGYRLGVTYPVIRSRNTNINIKLDVAHNLMQSDNNVNNADQNISNVLTGTVNDDWIDQWMGGGANHAELAVTAGKLQLGSKAKANDNHTNGTYAKVLITLSREQNIRPNLTLQAQVSHQLPSKNLDGSEKFSVGGPTSMPGYANGEASGDDGTLLRLKLNWRVRPDTAVGLFADYAYLHAVLHPVAASDCNPDTNITTNACHFFDAGLSLDWQGPKGLTASTLLAWAFGEKPNPADKDRPRFWFNLGYNW